MIDLNKSRESWLRDRSSYERFADLLRLDLIRRLQLEGIRAEVLGRTKEVDSLLKKLLIKPHLSYENLSDKAGLRIIVRFVSDIPPVRTIVEKAYQVLKVDDKTAALDVDQFSYQGVHLDIQLKGPSEAELEFSNYKAEIQIRTKSQNLWSELNHDLAYKTNITLPSDIRRRIHTLAALLEMADREFEAINHDIAALPGASALGILAALESLFLRLNPAPYSKELSVEVINLLTPLYSQPHLEIVKKFENLSEQQLNKMKLVFSQAAGRSVFLCQPEVIMIFDLIDRDEYTLKDKWNQRFPASELEELARIWGKPFD